MFTEQTGGVDYRKVVQKRPWPFHAFAKTVAQLMGRKDSLAGLSASELEPLKKVYNQSLAVNGHMVKTAFEKAPYPTVPCVIRELSHNRYHPINLHLTPLNANAFLRLIVTKLGKKPLLGKHRMLLQILDRINLNDKSTLFVIDEAHLIDPKILTDLRSPSTWLSPICYGWIGAIPIRFCAFVALCAIIFTRQQTRKPIWHDVLIARRISTRLISS